MSIMKTLLTLYEMDINLAKLFLNARCVYIDNYFEHR